MVLADRSWELMGLDRNVTFPVDAPISPLKFTCSFTTHLLRMLSFYRHGEHSGRRSRGARGGSGVARANGSTASRLHGKRTTVDGRDFASFTRRLEQEKGEIKRRDTKRCDTLFHSPLSDNRFSREASKLSSDFGIYLIVLNSEGARTCIGEQKVESAFDSINLLSSRIFLSSV